jgi:molybdate transport system permease protein
MSLDAGASDERREGALGLGLGALPFVLFAGVPLVALILAALPARPLERLAEPSVQTAIRLSLATSGIAVALAITMGLPVAYLLARFRFRGSAILDTLIDLPMTLPPVLAGLALLLTFGRMGLLGKYLEAAGVRIAFSTGAVILAQTFMSAPFFIRAARAGFESVPIALEEAAMTLGQNRWRVFWSVSAPLAAPALIAGAVLAWARALSEFGATVMVAGNLEGKTQTLPLAIYAAFESDLDRSLAICTVSLALAFIALVGAKLVVRRWSP